MPCDIRPLTPALQKIAIDELHEDPSRVEQDIEALKSWIQKEPNLRARTNDQFLLTFLRGSKFSLELAKEKIKNYYSFKENNPEFLKIPDIDSQKVKDLIRCGIVLYLPKPLGEAGPRVAFIRNGAYPTEKFSFADIAQLRQILQEIIMMEDDNAVVSGIVFVLDFSEVTASHFLQASPGNMRKVSQFGEKAVPLRIKASHFIDTPAGFEPVFNFVKPLMSQKMQQRMFVHGSKREELFKYIPKDILPKDYGGENSSIAELIDYWEKKIYSYRDFLKEDQLYGYKETGTNSSGQPSEYSSDGTSLGLVGSFRKLVVD